MAWLGNWNRRIKLTIDHGDIDDALSDFPILVYLSTSSGRNGKDVSCIFDELTEDANRKKIAVTKADGVTQCYVEIERWDDASEKAWLWVKVPAVASGTDTILYLYYDVNHADNTTYVGDTNSTPAENVWDEHFKLVCHMRDDPDNEHVRDSTGNNNDGTKTGADEPIEAAGEIDKAQDFDGEDDRIDHGDDPSLPFDVSDWSIELRFKWVSSTQRVGLFIKGSTFSGAGICIWGGSNNLRIFVGDGVNEGAFTITPTFNDSQWHRITYTRDGEVIAAYFDVAYVDEVTIPDLGDITRAVNFFIGYSTGTTFNYFHGLIDEVRVSDIARPAAWRKASDESETDNLVAFGSEERELPLVMCIGGCEYPLVYG